jgi:hypothetical protein
VRPGIGAEHARPPDEAEIAPIVMVDQALRPLDMGVDRHVARLGALARRQQKRQVGLLEVAQGGARLLQERLPGRVSRQCAFNCVATAWEMS